jgi:1,2-dihydroxy-3-keto-5-methylthiopentene dioxygenase
LHAVLCEAGDLLSVPGGLTHWFDMGTNPDDVAVRFFHDFFHDDTLGAAWA